MIYKVILLESGTRLKNVQLILDSIVVVYVVVVVEDIKHIRDIDGHMYHYK